MESKMKKAYTCFCTSVIHEGHLNILRNAKKYGYVVVGVLTDEAMITFNRFPLASLEERMQAVRDTGLADEVIVQDKVMYDDVIKALRPDYVIHGDNWKDGPEKSIRAHVESLLKEYGGELVDIPYTYNEDVKKIDMQLREKLAMPEYRRKRLRQLLNLVFSASTVSLFQRLKSLMIWQLVWVKLLT
jgi:phosphoenolpyruvate phosphomutase